MPVHAEHIPGALRDLPRWVCWRWTWNGKKWDKPPLDPRTGGPAKSTDPATWVPFDLAFEAHQMGDYDGVGITLGAIDDTGLTLCGLDLDGCLDAAGSLSPLAGYLLGLLDTYAERSPSGTGVKALCWGQLPRGKRADHARGIELYESGRYFTVTGRRLESYPAEVMERGEQLRQRHAAVFPPAGGKHQPGDRALALSALAALNPSRAVGYHSWLGVGMVLYSVDPSDAMLSVWDEWSRAAPDKYQDGACAAKWRSFHAGGGLSLGSLIHWAKEDGWTPPRSQSSNGRTRGAPVVDYGKPATPQPPPFYGRPRAIRADLLPVPALDPVLIPTLLRGWLADIASRGCFPLEYPTAAAVVALGSLVGRKVGIRPKRHDDWLVVPNLWGAIVGPPGIQKTPPVEEALRPLRRLVAEALEEHQEALRQFELDKAVSKARAKAAEKDLLKGAREKLSQEQLHALAKETAVAEEKPPVLKRYETNDPTVEKLGELLAENPNGILLFRDELMGFLRSLEKQGHESARAFYLESWSGLGSFTYDRIGRGTIHMPAVCLSLFGTIQPGPLARYVRQAATGDNDGLINRFQVLFYPDPPERWENVDRYPDSQEKDLAWKVFQRLAALDPALIGAQKYKDRPIPFLPFAADAQDFFDSWRSQLENRLRSEEDSAVLQYHLAKYRSLMPSLALLFHLIDSQDGPAGPVSLRYATTAAAWCDLLLRHAERIYHASFDGDLEPAMRLAQRLRESLPNPFRARDVLRKCWAGLDTTADVERALLLLEERNWIKAVEVPTRGEGGRPTQDYWINPAVMSPS